tara:strand:- start:404 stop:760 length:357 start_codon:yes stop_codon:yes gene_type:complete
MQRLGKDRLNDMSDVVFAFVDRVKQVRAFELRVVPRGVDMLIFFRIPNRRPFYLAAMMPFVLGQHHAAVHIETIDVKRLVKRMQNRRIVGIEKILRVELPVVMDNLTVHSKVLYGPGL